MGIDANMLGPLDALLQGPRPNLLRIGLALPLSGILGMVGPSVLDAVTLAGREVNATRASSERPVEFVVVDSGGAADAVASTLADLVRARAVEAVVGLHLSDTREAIETALAGQTVPYVFTPGHEDTPRPGFLCSGESAREQAAGLARVIADRGVHEWALLGSDYVWPRAVGAAARAVIETNGGQVLLDRLIPLGSVSQLLPGFLDELVACGARGIVLSLPGRDLSDALLGIRSRRLTDLVQFSASLEENVLYAADGDRTGNLYATQHSFDSVPSERHVELKARQRAAFGGDSPALDSYAEHCYDGVHLIANLERAELLAPASLGLASDANTPRAAIQLRPAYDLQLAVAQGLRFALA